MDAETEQLIREMWKDLSNGQRTLRAEMQAGFDRLTERVSALEERVTALEADVAAFKRQTAESFARVQRNFEAIQRNFEAIQRNFDRLLIEVRDPAQRERLERIEARLDRIEAHVGIPRDD